MLRRRRAAANTGSSEKPGERGGAATDPRQRVAREGMARPSCLSSVDAWTVMRVSNGNLKQYLRRAGERVVRRPGHELAATAAATC